MPWSRLRTAKAEDARRMRRHSAIEPPVLQDQAALGTAGPQRPDPHHAATSPSPLRKSFEPPGARDRNDGPARLPIRTAQDPPQKRQHFSMLARRHVSDPQISRTAKDQANTPVPPLPAAPTDPVELKQKRQSTFALPRRPKARGSSQLLSSRTSRKSLSGPAPEQSLNGRGPTSLNPSARESRITFDKPEKLRGLNSPPAYGDESNSLLALPISRLSESSRSDGSLGDHVYAQTTTHTVSTTTTFFRLPRRKKNKGPLFPLPVKIPAPGLTGNSGVAAPASLCGPSSGSLASQSPSKTPSLIAGRHAPDNTGLPFPLHSPAHLLDGTSRRNSTTSTPSGKISPITGSTMPFSRRGRSKGSLRQATDDDLCPTSPLPQSGRTSSSTGRASLGGIFNISRFRQNSEPQSIRHGTSHPPLPGTPISAGSKSQSLTISREPLVIPERQDGDTPAKYLIRLEEAVRRGVVATVLSQSSDDFSRNVLRSYMRGFKFFGDPLDMSTRKLLMEVELPKETQQIDRVLQAFANRYHECNPGVYASPDEAYFIAFSILILHTDVFNKNNKNKMQKHDYIKNARGQGVADEILECFYDNISYTPFIHLEDDLDINGERIVAGKPRKNLFTKQSTDSNGRPSREPVDPYTLFLDNRLDSLRPSLKDVMDLEDHYTYHGTSPSFNLRDLHKSFFKYGVLQILSSRSRPEAFMSPETMANPAEAHPGVVDIKVTKVGILWRKDTKKKKTRSPWQEWGAILTGAQLYFFRNSGWVKTLIHQHESHQKHGSTATPVIFKPPLEQFKPDVLMSTEDAVALQDTSYKKHKNAMVYIRHGGLEEIFLADNENELNDWLAKLNYAAAFRTAGVRTRGLAGAHIDVQKTRAMRRMNSDMTTQSSGRASGETAVQDDSRECGLARQIMMARRQIMERKIREADERLKESGRLLETQLRNARHLQILAPIQNRTREQVVLAAGGMAAKIKWTRIDMWRTRCHRDILAMDLEDEIKRDGYPSEADNITEISSQTVSLPHQDVRRNERCGSYSTTYRSHQHLDGDNRPATQPSPSKSLTADDVFESLENFSVVSNHKRKGSWELPPLSFQSTKASSNSGSSLVTTQSVRHPLVARPSLRSVSDGAKTSHINEMAAKFATPLPNLDNNEHEALKGAGIVEPQSPSSAKGKRPETPTGTATAEGELCQNKSPDTERSDGRAKVRRGLHRTLRDSNHVPSHHRSRKGKDSASSAVSADGDPSRAESEGLARNTGSFTFHGKKASVINFGSEWQSMSPDERLKYRKEAQIDGAKLSLPSAVEDDDVSPRPPSISSRSNHKVRPVSSVSTSTINTSTPFEEAIEEPMQNINSQRQLPQAAEPAAA
ncbi:MAG: hypothetical protein Q9163_000137 [Psora crenata]